MMSGTALFTFFFFFAHSAASPAGITMSSCLLLCFTPLPLQLASQCSAVTCPTGTRRKRVGNNTKLVCASGRQSVILANHTSIVSSILNPLDGLPRFPSCLWRRRDPRRYHHLLQGGAAISIISIPTFAISGAWGSGSSIVPTPRSGRRS
jgi:hypothetical protein